MNNSIFDPIDLTNVPPPQVIETPEFETIFQEILTQFQALVPDYALFLESDPVVKVVEAFAYRELVLRNRINAVAESNLLPFATGADLDNLGAFYNVSRLMITPAVTDQLGAVVIAAVMEDDDAFRYRIQQRRASTAGGAAHYKYWALTADPRVKDVAVYSPDFETPIPINMGGKVIIAVLSREGDGTPSEEVLTAVQDMIARDDVRVLTDIVEVIPAIRKEITVTAQIRLYPNTPLSEVTDAMTRLQTAFASVQGLGRDVTLSWLSDVMNSGKIHSITFTEPSEDVTVKPNEFPVLVEINPQFAGYSDSEGYGVVDLDSAKAQREVNRLYVVYAVANQRTRAQIQSDLAEQSPLGVIQPTLRGLSVYLNLLGTHDISTGEWLPDDELAFLIWRNLSKQYASS